MELETETSLQSLQSLLLFFLFFVLIYVVAYFIVFRNWTSKTRPEASSCLISLFHGTPAVFLATRAILADPNRGFSSPNTRTQNTVLEFSIAYFLMDLVHYLIFYPGEVLFIGHHLATLFVFLTCRYLVHHGAYAILSLLALAEVTSACQNAWTLASARRFDAHLAARVHELLSPPFYGSYSVARGCLGPYFVYQMGAFYMSGAADGVIPRWVWLSWLFVVVTAICACLLWIANLWVQWYREMSAKSDKKLR